VNRFSLTLTLSALGATALCAPAMASRAGITGRTESGCTTAGCHGGGALEPTITFEGPSTVAPGATATFSLILTGTQPGARTPAAGFNIGATGGTLAPADAQLKAVVAELVQNNMPIPFDNGETVKVSFNWTAPNEPGEFTLAGAGNSVNGDFVPSGDASAVTTHVVTVSADAPPVGGAAGGVEPPAGGGVAGGTEPPSGGTPATGADAGPSGGAPASDDTSDSSGCQAAPGRGAPASALLALLALPLLRRRRR